MAVTQESWADHVAAAEMLSGMYRQLGVFQYDKIVSGEAVARLGKMAWRRIKLLENCLTAQVTTCQSRLGLT